MKNSRRAVNFLRFSTSFNLNFEMFQAHIVFQNFFGTHLAAVMRVGTVNSKSRDIL